MKRAIALVSALALLTVVFSANGCRPSATTQGSQEATAPVGSGTGISVIGHGAEVDLKEHLVAGKTTVVDFYSDYCPACVMLAPELEKLAAKRSDVAIVKVDVNRPEVKGKIDWDSPVAQQHELESLPHLVIFDGEGHEIASGQQAYERIVGWLEA